MNLVEHPLKPRRCGTRNTNTPPFYWADAFRSKPDTKKKSPNNEASHTFETHSPAVPAMPPLPRQVVNPFNPSLKHPKPEAAKALNA